MGTGQTISLLLSKSRSGAELGFSCMCCRVGEEHENQSGVRDRSSGKGWGKQFLKEKKKTLNIFLTLIFALEGTVPLVDLWYLDAEIALVPEDTCSFKLLERNLVLPPSSDLDQTCNEETWQAGKGRITLLRQVWFPSGAEGIIQRID